MKNKWFAFVLIVYTVFGIFTIYNNSTVVNGERYFLLADDPTISMQYAKNFAEGKGFVWYDGLKVEGITNPLWATYMAIPHKMGIPLSKTGLFIQITALILMLILMWLVWTISWDLYAVILTGFFLPLNFCFYAGYEVSILSVLLLMSYRLAVGPRVKYPFLAYLILGVCTLIRMDMAIFFVPLLYYDKKKAFGVSVLILFLLGQTVWRYGFYGDIAPNTVYLKLYGYDMIDRLVRGVGTFINNTYYMNWLLLFIILPFMGNEWLRFKMFPVLVAVFYSIWIGGDFIDNRGGTNRFISVAMPFFFMVLSDCINRLMYYWREKEKYNWDYGMGKVVHILVLTVILLNMNMVLGPKSIFQYFKPFPETVASVNTLKIALDLRDNYPKDIVIASQGAGVIVYFSEKNRYIDLLGKNDRRIAHMSTTYLDSVKPWRTRLWKALTVAPGHIKFDQDYSIKELKPDVVVHPVLYEDILPYMRENYVESTKPDYSMVWFKKEKK